MRAALLMLILSASSTVFAESQIRTNDDDRGAIATASDWLKDQKAAPVESQFVLPKVASLASWVAFSLPQESTRKNAYFLAVDSLSLADDQIVRYAIAIKPAGGNVTTLVYEGLDCASNQHRRYASATLETEWQMSSRNEWKPNSNKGHNAWHGQLADNFCKQDSPWPLDVIKKDFNTGKLARPCEGCTPH
jgi:CNP1-like family